MWEAGRGKRISAWRVVSVSLLTVAAWCCSPSRAWALTSGESAAVFPQSDTVAAQDGWFVPTLYQSRLSLQEGAAQDAPLFGRFQLALGGPRKLTLNAFNYSGRQSRSILLLGPTSVLTGASADPDGPPLLLPRSSPEAARTPDDQAQSFQADFDSGRGKFGLRLTSVGSKFPEAAKSLQGVPQSDLKPLLDAAGTRALNLTGSYLLFPGASFTTTRTSLANDKPGDGKRGLATTDWVNALSMSLGKGTSMRFALTDHTEAWDPTAGKTGLSRRTTEFGGESKFGAGGKHSLRFGLTDVNTAAGGSEQREQTRELHLALPLHSRLRLNADYTAKEGTGGTQTTNLASAVMQLYPGGELTTNLKTLTVGGKETRETAFKFAGGVGHGSSAARLLAEQTTTRTPDQGVLTNAKFDLNGGLGAGGGRVNLRSNYQERRGETASGPLERAFTFHLDRGFGPRFTLNLDHEEKTRGTVGAPVFDRKSVCGLTATLAPQTKLTAGISSQDDGTATFLAWNRDLTLEHRLGGLLLRAAERRRDYGPAQKRETGFGVDRPQGKLPDWAANLTRRHEFGDAYEYMVRREAGWLDLPFAGTRFWMDQRTGGEDEGARTLLVSHRTVLAGRYHLQLTYHDRPEHEEGDKKGRPQPLRRHYAELGTPLGRGLVGRTWLTAEQKLDDPLSQRRSVGLAIAGKLPSQAQVEVDCSHDTGSWEGRAVRRDAASLFYSRRLDDERNLSLKLGYAWGENVADSRDRDCRLTLAYANPL